MSTRSVRIIVRHPRRSKEPVLWIIDSEQWPRACLRAELIERGYDPYGFITIADALDSIRRGISPKPQAVVLELREQNFTHEMIETIRKMGIPTILLGGNLELNDPVIRQHRWDVILKRPFSLGTVADAVQNLVPAKNTNTRIRD
jgi:DNA-binding NtrC family response regulator